MSEPLVSVVIPTLGRASLRDAIASARRQDTPTEVIVVNDSGAPLAAGLVADGVRVLETEGRTGAAHARNLGMRAAGGDLVAFLDDDDVWLPGHLARAVAELTAAPDADLYSCRGLVVYGPQRSRLEPVELVGDRTLAEYFFGRDAWLSRCRRVMTPTLVFRRSLADLPMDTGLRQSEDTWWLLTAERERGARLVQSANVGVVVHASPDRESGRRRDDVAWARRLESLVPGAGPAHLAAGRARDAWRAGDPGEVARLGRAALGFRGGWRWAAPVGVQVLAAASVRARRLIGRKRR